MSTEIGITGYAPTIAVRPIERDLYKSLWEKDDYRGCAPGEECVQDFLRQAKPRDGAPVIDLGCGTGRPGLLLALLGSVDVTLLDFAPNCLDDDIREMIDVQPRLHFVEADLTKPLPIVAPYGFCADVLEHIPPAQLDDVIANCLHACQHVFFQIATVPDKMGEPLAGVPLHLSVHNYSWWLRKFNEFDCVIHWSANREYHCLFYVSAWTEGREIADAGMLNTEEEQILKNVKHNIGQGWQQVTPHETNEVEVMILGGGPSLAENEDLIREMHDQGVKIVTLNGAYNWCQERGIGPGNQIIVDAREFNKRFTHPVDETWMYFIASQCDPGVFEGLPKARTYIWHTSAAMIRDLLDDQYEEWWGNRHSIQ